MPILESPLDDYIGLADWLELSTIESTSSVSSVAAIEQAIRAAEGPDMSEDIEQSIGGVMTEIELRSNAADVAYPIDVAGDTLTLKDNWPVYLPYVFCLVLSYFGFVNPQARSRTVYPERWFEHLSRNAAQSYMSGPAVRFGWPRDPQEIPASFPKAVDYICQNTIKEGIGYKSAPIPDDKDAGIDVIACHSFPDNLPGRIILFGQCAAGRGWDQKVNDLQPKVFISEWLKDSPRSPFVKALFIPHCIERHHLEHNTRHAGIIFDRCRTALWAHRFMHSHAAGLDIESHKSYFPSSECERWTEKMLKGEGSF